MIEFKVGDLVQVKDWDEMIKEFGIYSWGSIKCKFEFVRSMKKFCGKKLRITAINDDKFYLENDDYWDFSTDMFKHYKGEINVN